MSLNPRGNFRGRGRGAVTSPARQQMPMVPISLAKQGKPPEERLYSRFKELEPDAVRVTRYKSGSILEEVLLQKPDKSGTQWYSTVHAEEMLSSRKAEIAKERARMRAPTRLGKYLDDKEYQALPDSEKRILLMTQKEYNSFRASKGAQGTFQVPDAANAASDAANAAPPGTTAAVPGGITSP